MLFSHVFISANVVKPLVEMNISLSPSEACKRDEKTSYGWSLLKLSYLHMLSVLTSHCISQLSSVVPGSCLCLQSPKIEKIADHGHFACFCAMSQYNRVLGYLLNVVRISPTRKHNNYF